MITVSQEIWMRTTFHKQPPLKEGEERNRRQLFKKKTKCSICIGWAFFSTRLVYLFVTVDELNPDKEQFSIVGCVEFDEGFEASRFSDFSGQPKVVENCTKVLSNSAAKDKRGSARPRFVTWPSRFGKNNPFSYYCQRNGGRYLK